MVGGLIATRDAVEDGVGRKVDKFGAEVEAKLRELFRDVGVEYLGARGVSQAGFDRRQGGAMHDRLRELFEH